MKLASLSAVNHLVAARDRQVTAMAEVESDQLNVLIRGTYQDDAIVALVRPIILGELKARRHRIEADLKELGVELR